MIVNDLPTWHAIVCARENFTCRICKTDFSYEHYFQEDNNRRVNQYTTGHHVKTQKAFPELRLDTDNGCCLCLGCHTKVHKGVIEIPELEFKTTENYAKVSKSMQNQEFDHVLPSGRGIQLRAHEKLCKCRKYIAQDVTGVCMNCEHRKTNFKEEKKEKKKKY